jgi:hypothetical protein
MDQLVRLPERQGAEEIRVHHAEDRGVRGDPEREGRHDQRRIAGNPAQGAHRVLHVLSQLVE